jgi:hypothetical protein
MKVKRVPSLALIRALREREQASKPQPKRGPSK